jgi:hypothetical protein
MMPPGGIMPPMMGMPGGAMGNRLGAYLERPSETLIEQLDLPKDQGLVLAHVQPGSAAAKAGFKSHDILLQLNGKAVPNNPWQLDNQLRALKPDQKIDAVVLRKGHKKTIKDFTLPEARFGGMPGMPGMGGAANMQQMMRMMQMGQHPPGGPGMAPPGGLHGMIGPGMPGMPGMPGRIMNTVTAVATSSNGVMTTLFKSNDHFTARHQEGNLIITVEGKTPGRKADVNEITVQDGQAKSTYKSVDKVPTRYRDKVKNLVELSAGNNAKIKVTAPAEDKHAEEGPLNRGEKK